MAKEKKPKELPLDFEDLANEVSGVVEYPIRKPEEDQMWAVNTVRIWVGAVTFAILGIMTLMILGAIYA